MFSKLASKVFGGGPAEIALETKPLEPDSGSTETTSVGEVSGENDSVRSCSSTAVGEEEEDEQGEQGEGVATCEERVEAADDFGETDVETARVERDDVAAGIEEETAEEVDLVGVQVPEGAPEVLGATNIETSSKRQRASRLPHARRQQNARKKYEGNADGTYSKSRAVCEWDLTGDGDLILFASEEAFLEHEERCYLRRQRGEHPRRYGFETLSQEQQALASAINVDAEENRELICETVEESAAAVLKELDHLGQKLEQRLEAGQAERADGDARFAIRELVYESLKASEIRELLGMRGVEDLRSNKWTLASKAALVCTAAQVQDFLASRKGANDAPGSSASKREHTQTAASLIQSTLPVVKKPRAIGN